MMIPIRLAVLVGTLLLSPVLVAAELPQYSDELHLGVASCASGVCHGSVAARTATSVNQNEYVIWSRRDRHRIAYNTLLTDESKRIAKNLGLKNAHEANMCLDCHADNVAVELRGDRFQVDDSIGCEACHGGAENYISSHVDPGTPRAENIANGLYPTDEPKSRAKLCLSCHLGNGQKMASHDIMGAGHPRISFELDTFSWLQPAHYEMDQDYKKRKWSGTSVSVWSYGQVEAARQTLQLIDERLEGQGLFPELSLFDCHACHHPMSDTRWQPGGFASQPPGTVRLNDANFLMVIAIAETLAPEIGKSLHTGLTNLHTGVGKGAPAGAIANLHGMLDQLDNRMQQLNPTDHTLNLANSVVKLASSGRMTDYVAAEQSLMAVDLLLTTANQRQPHAEWLDRAYGALADETGFDPAVFQRIMKQFRG